MDVGIPRELAQVDLDALLLEVDTYHQQTALVAEWIIDGQMNKLMNHLEPNYPGLVIPPNGPHFQFVMHCMEELATTWLELENVAQKANDCRDIVKKAGRDFHEFKETKCHSMDVLQDIGNSLLVVSQRYLEIDGESWKLLKRCEKLLDLTKVIDNAPNEAVLLTIFRKGIAEVNRDFWQDLISSLKHERRVWAVWKSLADRYWPDHLNAEMGILRRERRLNKVVLCLFASLLVFWLYRLFKVDSSFI